MGKSTKKSNNKANNKALVKAQKKDKQAKKFDQKSKKQLASEAAIEEEDLLTTLEEFRAKWEADHKVTEDLIDGPPSRRANASFTPDPNQPYIWLFGGEFFNGTTAHFYNDLYRYSPDKNEWRRYSSPTFPPRSTHQMVATPGGGGKLWLFGGEFASSNQTTFHHYRDMWCFDLSTHSWERIETKIQPSARSGHRMVVWKQWIILFGWQQITSRDNERWPSARSGLSLLSIPEGIILHALDDTFFLKLDPTNPDWLKKLKWEKRKRVGQVPNLRSGSTMVNWVNKALAVGFGGVLDLEDNEEGLVSEFYNDLYAYQLSGNGRWMSLNLKKPKKKKVVPSSSFEEEEDPEKTIPLARFNPMLAVLKNTLYIGSDDDEEDEDGGGSDGSGSDTDSNDEAHDTPEQVDTEEKQFPIVDESMEVVQVTQLEQEELKKKVEAFMGVAKSTERSIEEIMSTPLPGETLKLFYDRSREYWTQKAHATSQHRGKELRRDGFSHAEERYSEYKPLLDEIERIQAEAGIEASDVQRRTGPTVGGGGLTQDSRHRR
ncbi:hypothetical protein PSHT_08281 [Puccinia striiformis]|uniref:DUF4110 domain-containing protein n=1 Tax=Puccinia striiformis TaxID=27350 RepID=A0A2S4VQT3_9BASI|nr:hypothetical protein PSHT_08281 [Puccinia striiformis]